MTTGISTSFVTSSYNNTYYSTANTTLGTSFIPSTSSSSTTSTTPATPFYHEECDNQSDIRLDNGTCIAKSIARVGYDIIIFFILLVFFLYTYPGKFSQYNTQQFQRFRG